MPTYLDNPHLTHVDELESDPSPAKASTTGDKLRPSTSQAGSETERCVSDVPTNYLYFDSRRPNIKTVHVINPNNSLSSPKHTKYLNEQVVQILSRIDQSSPFPSNRVKRSLVAKANNPLCFIGSCFLEHTFLPHTFYRRKYSQLCISTSAYWRGAWSPSSYTRRSMWLLRNVSLQVSCLMGKYNVDAMV